MTVIVNWRVILPPKNTKKKDSYLFLVELVNSGTAIIADRAICQEANMTSCSIRGRKRYAPLTLLFARSGVLHPKHVTVFTANFMSPPTVGVAIWMVLVCSPDTITTKLSTVHTSSQIMNVAHVKSWLSPPKLAQKCALVVLRAGFPNSTLYRSGYYFLKHKSGPRIFRRPQRLQPSKPGLCEKIFLIITLYPLDYHVCYSIAEGRSRALGRYQNCSCLNFNYTYQRPAASFFQQAQRALVYPYNLVMSC